MFQTKIFLSSLTIFLLSLFIQIEVSSAQTSDDEYAGNLTFEISESSTSGNFYSIYGTFTNSQGLPLENKLIIVEREESDESSTFVMSLETDENGYYWGNVKLEPPGQSNSEATLCAFFDGDVEIDPTDYVCHTIILHIIVQERPVSFIEEAQDSLDLPINSIDNSTSLLLLSLIVIAPIIAGGIFIKKHYSKKKCIICGRILSSKSISICQQCTERKKIRKESTKQKMYEQFSKNKNYDPFSKSQNSKLFEQPKRKFEGRTYYEILGLDKNSTSEEIKSRYRELCLKFHPDKEKSSLANEFMQEIKEAYETLSDSKKRQNYDTTI